MGVNELPLIEDTDALNDFVRSLISTAEFVPGGLIGFDREGNIVGFQYFGQFHPGHVHRCARNSDAYRLSIVETAMIYKVLAILPFVMRFHLAVASKPRTKAWPKVGYLRACRCEGMQFRAFGRDAHIQANDADNTGDFPGLAA